VTARRSENRVAVVHLLEDFAADPGLWAGHVRGDPYALTNCEYR